MEAKVYAHDLVVDTAGSTAAEQSLGALKLFLGQKDPVLVDGMLEVLERHRT